MNFIHFLLYICVQCLIARLDCMAVRRAAVPVQLLNADEAEMDKEMDSVRFKPSPFLSAFKQ